MTFKRCPGTGRPPAVLSPGAGCGECPACHSWHGVWPAKKTMHAHKDRRYADDYVSEVDAVFGAFWVDVVMPNGKWDYEQLKKELFDYHTLLSQVPKVYDHITRGRVSKPHTRASEVIAIHDELCSSDEE